MLAGTTNINRPPYCSSLSAIVAKEKPNDFIKTTNTTKEAIYEKLGFDLNIHESLIQKQYDEDGHLYLTWGNQRIV